MLYILTNQTKKFIYNDVTSWKILGTFGCVLDISLRKLRRVEHTLFFRGLVFTLERACCLVKSNLPLEYNKSIHCKITNIKFHFNRISY